MKLGEFKIEDVLPYITKNKLCKKEYVVNGKTYSVKMNSDRYFLFEKSRKCVVCGLEGTKFILEYHREEHQENHHFNLYGEENGREIMLTKDHIIPKSKKGKNHVSNYQVLCEICNIIKGDKDISLEDIKMKRDYHNKFYDEFYFNKSFNSFQKQKLDLEIHYGKRNKYKSHELARLKRKEKLITKSKLDVFAYNDEPRNRRLRDNKIHCAASNRDLSKPKNNIIFTIPDKTIVEPIDCQLSHLLIVYNNTKVFIRQSQLEIVKE